MAQIFAPYLDNRLFVSNYLRRQLELTIEAECLFPKTELLNFSVELKFYLSKPEALLKMTFRAESVVVENIWR